MGIPDAPIDDLEALPDYWLVQLLRSLRESDFASAAEAHDRLAQLGIDVTFRNLLPDWRAEDA